MVFLSSLQLIIDDLPIKWHNLLPIPVDTGRGPSAWVFLRVIGCSLSLLVNADPVGKAIPHILYASVFAIRRSILQRPGKGWSLLTKNGSLGLSVDFNYIWYSFSLLLKQTPDMSPIFSPSWQTLLNNSRTLRCENCVMFDSRGHLLAKHHFVTLQI